MYVLVKKIRMIWCFILLCCFCILPSASAAANDVTFAVKNIHMSEKGDMVVDGNFVNNGKSTAAVKLLQLVVYLGDINVDSDFSFTPSETMIPTGGQDTWELTIGASDDGPLDREMIEENGADAWNAAKQHLNSRTWRVESTVTCF